MSFAEDLLSKIEDVLLNKANSDAKSVSYNGKKLEKYTFEELMILRDKLIREINAQKRVNALQNGLNPKNKVVIRW